MVNDKFDIDSYYGEGIPFREGWGMKKVRLFTKVKCGYWFDNVYDFDEISMRVRHLLQNKAYQPGKPTKEVQELDPFLWEEFTGKIEKARQFAYDTFREYGVNEPESHFLSIKFARRIISEFRLQLFIQFGGKETKKEFENTALRNAINMLDGRFMMMSVYDQYLFSKLAASPELADFRKAAALETAREIIEETGAILHAKLTM